MSVVVDAALDRKAEDVTILDMNACSSFTDYFVICHGRGTRQARAISDKVEERLKEAKVRPAHIEGYSAGEWILMDYIDFVVHIFTGDKRKFYGIEKLWADAPRVEMGAPRQEAFDK